LVIKNAHQINYKCLTSTSSFSLWIPVSKASLHLTIQSALATALTPFVPLTAKSVSSPAKYLNCKKVTLRWKKNTSKKSSYSSKNYLKNTKSNPHSIINSPTSTRNTINTNHKFRRYPLKSKNRLRKMLKNSKNSKNSSQPLLKIIRTILPKDLSRKALKWQRGKSSCPKNNFLPKTFHPHKISI
jgi:hypothetical protein